MQEETDNLKDRYLQYLHIEQDIHIGSMYYDVIKTWIIMKKY